MPNNDYILRSDALKATCGSLCECNGKPPSTWACARNGGCETIQAINTVPAADVEPKRKWIPVTERLPDFTDRFIIILKRNDEYVPKDEEWDESYLRVTKFDVDTGNWCLSKRVKKCTEVTHWMPLPEPPKGDKAE